MFSQCDGRGGAVSRGEVQDSLSIERKDRGE